MAAGIHVVAETCIIVLTHAISGLPLYVDIANIGGMWSNKIGGSVLIFSGGGKIAVNEKIADIIGAVREQMPPVCLRAQEPHVHPHNEDSEE